MPLTVDRRPSTVDRLPLAVDRRPLAVDRWPMPWTVAELRFVADWYDPAYYSKCTAPCTNPQGPSTGTQRVLRGGGAWFMDAPHVRLASRGSEHPASQVDYFGFRCAK